MFQKKPKINIPPRLLKVAIIFFIAAFVFASAYLIFEKIYQNKIYPGVWIGEINLKGKTAEQTKNIINKQINNISQSGVVFYYQKKQITVTPAIASADGSFAYQIISFDAKKSIEQAYNFGRDNTFFSNLKNKINALIYKRTINLSLSMNETKVQNILMENFSIFETPAKNAELIFDKQTNNFIASEEKLGKTINYQKAIRLLGSNLLKLNDSSIRLYTKTDYPVIYKKACLNIDAKAKQILSLAPLTLKYQNNQWDIKKNQLSDWLGLKINQQTDNQNKILVGLNKKIVEQFLRDEIASTTDMAPIEAKFEIKNNKVAKFQASKDGLKLNIESNAAKIELELLENRQNTIELIKTELKSAAITSSVNGFGISEIIGIGESNFFGSPQNRRHNIKNGADTLNGMLIKPNEEFSLNSALGEINAETEYLPELVIKGNKTIMEYGGGLCQIGTTIFRAALSAGLPITQRRNHAYRVVYYEPAGTDAAIYDPWPDVRFINNTNNHILIQSRIEGDNLYFDFWGTEDGRIVEKTEPAIYNIVKPGPTKYIETLDLEPGKEKCTEHAHNGADAYFDYKVIYANGETKEKRFNSHYAPWQAVCLIGVEKLSDDQKTATSTEKIIE